MALNQFKTIFQKNLNLVLWNDISFLLFNLAETSRVKAYRLKMNVEYIFCAKKGVKIIKTQQKHIDWF